ncbi:hypothetical protein GCM10027614_70790 [Micromonospora vulcania]
MRECLFASFGTLHWRVATRSDVRQDQFAYGEVQHRVDGSAFAAVSVEVHLEVQMRSAAVAGRPHAADDLPGNDLLADVHERADEENLGVRVEGVVNCPVRSRINTLNRSARPPRSTSRFRACCRIHGRAGRGWPWPTASSPVPAPVGEQIGSSSVP